MSSVPLLFAAALLARGRATTLKYNAKFVGPGETLSKGGAAIPAFFKGLRAA